MEQNNREALWPSHYAKTDAYNLISTLNQLRNFLVATTDWAKQETQMLTAAPEGVVIMKGPVISILTNIGSPVCQNLLPILSIFLTHVLAKKQYVHCCQHTIPAIHPSYKVCSCFHWIKVIHDTPRSIFTCLQWVVGAKGKIEAQYTSGGAPNVLILPEKLKGSGLCEAQLATTDSSASSVKSSSSPTISSWRPFAISVILSCFLYPLM